MVDQPYQFDFYDGGGIDCAFSSFALVDPAGNVNISRFADKIVGTDGFINISQNAKKVVFSDTSTAGGLKVALEDGKLRIVEEGPHPNFVSGIEQICYHGAYAREQGRQAPFVTERVVFRVADDALKLVKIVPGINLEQDVLAHMAFRPRLADQLDAMDPLLFRAATMGLHDDPTFVLFVP